MRRSCLSVPASRPRFLEKADASAADMILLDLEDSVAPSAKESARSACVSALRTFAYEGKVRGVRVNAVTTAWCLDDVRCVVEEAGDRIDVLVVPKVEGPSHVHYLHHLLDQLEPRSGLDRRIGLELQIESAGALESAPAIAAASPRCETLVFGPGDLGASLGMPGLTVGGQPPAYPGDVWHYFQARMLVAARAHGLQAIDGPYVQVRDLSGLRAAAMRTAALGYDGKWALHPDQVAVLNEVYAPTQADFDRAWAIMTAYEQATAGAVGAVVVDDEMIDEASRKLAEVTVARGRAQGMSPSGAPS